MSALIPIGIGALVFGLVLHKERPEILAASSVALGIASIYLATRRLES